MILNDKNLNAEFFEFIRLNKDSDPAKLRLKRNVEKEFDMDMAITQIECRRKIRKKLPEIFENPGFIFPSVLSTEQCTCESVARLHADIIGNIDTMLDMTAGLCIDDYYIAKGVKHITAIELSDLTASVSTYNMSHFRNNITVICGNSVDYVKQNSQIKYDAAFIDPARRGDNNSRLFGMNDCVPDVIAILDDIRLVTNVLYIKASPMLDVSQSLHELDEEVSDVWVVSEKNECKELFFKVVFGSKNISPTIHCINLTSDDCNQRLSFNFGYKSSKTIDYATSIIQNTFLYEPNSSIMKAHGFETLSEKFNVIKLAPNSHLYNSSDYISNFPGRIFRINEVIPFKDKEAKCILKEYKQLNVGVRNFKLTADQLKKRYKLKDGGEKYLFGTTLWTDEMVLILCEKE